MIPVFAFIIINIIMGYLLCFHGSKIVGNLLTIFLILLSAGFIYQKYGFNTKAILIFLLFMAVVILVFKIFVNIGLFLLGSLTGYLLSLALLVFLPKNLASYKIIFEIIFAISFGSLLAFYKNKLLAIITAYLGANILSRPLIFMTININNLQILTKNMYYKQIDDYIESFAHMKTYNKIFLIGTLILTIFGFLYQSRKKRTSK